ncbi:hypothetical protein F5Y18DRAFT_374490 [Xylariaceae sp. FL1019]|nr:hypothetical protein F5Y18DRAFT_374490 [Xylariaceae sp. FL1019]
MLFFRAFLTFGLVAFAQAAAVCTPGQYACGHVGDVPGPADSIQVCDVTKKWRTVGTCAPDEHCNKKNTEEAPYCRANA